MANVAQIGLGRWGRRIFSTLKLFANVSVVCTTGGVGGRRWLTETSPGTRWTDSYGEILLDREIEAVVLATPITTHFRLAKLALEHGKHVFVEKPMATALAAGTELVRLARERQRIVFVGHTFLFDDSMRALYLRTLDDPVRKAFFSWRKYGTFGEPLLWSLLPHDIALALCMFGAEPVGVKVLAGAPWDRACDEASVVLDFGSDRSATIAVSRQSSVRQKSVRLWTVGEALYQGVDGVARRIDGAGRWQYCSGRAPLANEIRTFLECLAGEPRAADHYMATGLAVVRTLSRLDDANR